MSDFDRIDRPNLAPELAEVADLLREAAQEHAPPLELDPVAAMLGLAHVDPNDFGIVPASSERGGPKDMWAVTYRGQTLCRFDRLADAEADMLDRHQRAIRDTGGVCGGTGWA